MVGLIRGPNIHVYVDISLFSSYQATNEAYVLMGNGLRASIHGVGMIDLKFTLGETALL